MALHLVDSGTASAMCQCCSRRTVEKDGGDGEDAAASASEREQMGNSQKKKTRAEMKKEAKLLRVQRGSTSEDTKESATSSLG